jgi:hypothetical protein
MQWTKVLKKGLLGTLTFLSAGLIAQPHKITDYVENPTKAVHFLIGSIIAGFIVGGNNFIKHRKGGKNGKALCNKKES